MARALCLPLLLSILLSRSLAEDEPPLPFAVFNTTRVNCPSTVTEFTALTELILEGPRDPADTDGSGILYRREWESLQFEFMKIYNTITTQSCDANFRKMGNLTIVSVEVLGSNSNSEADPKRFLQSNQSFVSETFPAVNMSLTYHVQGRCRNCPVAPGGSFQLYDDVFRRRLGIQSSLVKILNVRELQEDESIAFADDCFCREGLEPVQPQAPGVQECIDAMNIKFDNLAVTDGLFQNISMLNLFQLDDLDHEEDSVTSSSVSATVWGNPLFAVPCLTTCSGIAGGILGLLSFF